METVNIFTIMSWKASLVVILWLVLAVVIGYKILSKKTSDLDDFMEHPKRKKK